jgi:hypothetical protein
MTTKTLTTDVPLSAIGYPTKVYPQASIVLFVNGEALAGMPVDDAPDFGIPRPEVDLGPDYARTLTRTFVTYSTHTSAYSSLYTVKAPLAVTLPWMPIVLLSVGAGLLGSGVYVHHRTRRTGALAAKVGRDVCGRCGTPIPDMSRYCEGCGLKIVDSK